MKSFLAAFGAMLCFAGSYSIAFSQSPDDLDDVRFRPVAFKCPYANRGPLELVSRAQTGEQQKIVAIFGISSGVPKINTLNIFYKKSIDEPWSLDFSGNLLKENSEEDRTTIDKALKVVAAVFTKVCNGTPDAIQRFEKLLVDNAKM